MTAAIVCSDLSFSWPDGAPVLRGLTVSLGPARTGLIGVNGSGKSTRAPAPVRRGRVLDRVMVIVSHDRELLGLVDQIADLSGGEVRMYGGNVAAYEERLAAEQAAAERAVTAASADVRREQRDLVEAQVKQARRDRHGRKLAASGSIPRIVAHARKRAAQETAGRSRELHAERLQAARDRLEEAAQALRDDTEIRVDLPGTAVPAGRTVLTVTGLTGSHWHPAAPALETVPAAPGFAPVPDAPPAPGVTSSTTH